MPALERNQQFERYRILQWLGNGVSGESYEAVDTMLQRKVALKLIHPWYTLPDSAHRQFFREMQGISTLNHPYLAATLDYGEIDGRLYVVHRYLSNGSLLSNAGRLWFKPPLNVEDAIQYGHQLAQALDYIHNCGYLHGAVTLPNILVLRGPNVDHEPSYAPFLLTDVGLSNYVRRFGQPQIKLLPVTAAPEQIGKRVTPASDQFALAALLYFWLTGRPPYLGTPEESEHAKLTRTFPPLFSLNPDVSYEQEEVLRRALSIYPEERYPSVAAFADVLVATLTPPINTPPPTPSPIETHQPDLKEQPESLFEAEALPQAKPAPVNEYASAPQFETRGISEFEAETPPVPGTQTETENIPVVEASSSVELAIAPGTDPFSANETEVEAAPMLIPHPEPSLTLEQMLDALAQPLPPVFQPGIQLPPKAPFSAEEAPTITESPTYQEKELMEIEIQAGQAEQVTQVTQPIAIPRLQIKWLSGGETREYLLEHKEILLGRAGSDDVLLDQDSSTSRHHALLKYDNGQYLIYDQRSASGVFVNGEKLNDETGRALVNGDHILIGNYELIFRWSSAGVPQQEENAQKSSADSKKGHSTSAFT